MVCVKNRPGGRKRLVSHLCIVLHLPAVVYDIASLKLKENLPREPQMPPLSTPPLSTPPLLEEIEIPGGMLHVAAEWNRSLVLASGRNITIA